jgi:hypothetical protein
LFPAAYCLSWSVLCLTGPALAARPVFSVRLSTSFHTRTFGMKVDTGHCGLILYRVLQTLIAASMLAWPSIYESWVAEPTRGEMSK